MVRPERAAHKPNDLESTRKMKKTTLAFSALLLSFASACETSTPATQDTGRTDTGVADTGAQGSDVARCQTAVQTLVDVCQSAGESDRACLWTHYKTLCATGNAKAIADGASCFASDTICRSFSDPGTEQGRTCLNASLTTNQNATSESIRTKICGASLCASENFCQAGQRSATLHFEFLSNATRSTLETCVNSATTCGAATTCASAALANNCS